MKRFLYKMGKKVVDRIMEKQVLRPVPNGDGGRMLEWAFVLKHASGASGRLLDVGSGRGELALFLARRGYDVTALDSNPMPVVADMENLHQAQQDLLGFQSKPFDVIVVCSTVEHIGISGRYNQPESTDGDLLAMRHLKSLAKKDCKVLLTIPVGKDAIIRPLNRVYGEGRLPLLLKGYELLEEEYWVKEGNDNIWRRASRAGALSQDTSEFYSPLGMFLLKAETASE